MNISNANERCLTALPEENYHIKKPALFIAATRDSLCRADFGKAFMPTYAAHAEIAEVDTGHWLQLEASAKVNDLLEKWLAKLPST